MSKNVSLELLEQQKSCVKNRTEFCAVGSIPEEGPAVTRGWFTRVRVTGTELAGYEELFYPSRSCHFPQGVGAGYFLHPRFNSAPP
jgi:hypothetical protein